MTKRVAIVLNTSWNIFNFRLNLARYLKNNGYEVVLIAPYDKYSQKLQEEFEYHQIKINNKGTNPFEDLKTLIDFYILYKKLGLDVVLHYTIKANIYGSIAASILGIKIINNIAGLGTLFVDGRESFVTKIAKKLYRYSQSKANKIFFQNKEDYEMFCEQNIVEPKICQVLPGSGVDIEKFKPSKILKKDKMSFKFILVARMIKEKGIKEYIDAANNIHKLYPNTEFFLLGFLDVKNPSAISQEQMDIWTEPNFITYLGASDDVKSELENIDFVVLPSYYKEGTPRVLLESASMQKPIVTTDNVGCRDVVDDGINGYICKMKDTKSLQEKMEKLLLLNENERNMMGEKGREKVSRTYDEKIILKNYLESIKAFVI